MSGIKTLFNTQWGRVLDVLSSAVPSADNEGREPSVTPRGALWVAIDGTVGPAPAPYTNKTFYSSAGLFTSGSIFPGQCDLLEFTGFKNATAALRYIQIFPFAAVPANGAIPLYSIPLPGSNTTFSLSLPMLNVGSPFTAAGISWALSSTAATKTLALTGTAWVNALVGV